MTYSEAEARIAELRQRLENIKSTLGAGDIGISVDPQAAASAQTQAYHEQFTPQGLVPQQQGTEMFPAASTGVATMPGVNIEEQMGKFIPPGESFLGNLAKGIPRFAGSQLMFAEQAIKDPVAGLKGLGEFAVGAIEKASYLGIPSRFQHLAPGEREKQLTEEFLNYPFEYFLQVTAPFFMGIGGAKLVARAKTIHGLIKKGKSFKEATTIGVKVAGIKSPEAAIAKWDAEITRQFEQQPKPKLKETPDALQGKEVKAKAPQAQEVAPAPKEAKQPWEMTSREYMSGAVTGVGRRQIIAERRGMGRRHAEIVREAVEESKPVPAEVLAEYPELAKPKVEKGVVENLMSESDTRWLDNRTEAIRKARDWKKRVYEDKGQSLSDIELSKTTIEGGTSKPKDFSRPGIMRYVEVAWPNLVDFFKTKVATKRAIESAIKNRELKWSRSDVVSVQAGKLNEVFSGGASSVKYDLFTRESFDSWAAKTLSKKSQPLKPKVEKGAVEPAKPVVVEKPKPIGLKKTEIEQIRRNTGIDQLEPAERRGWEEVLHKAKNEKVDQTILASTDEIIKTGRQISDVEHAGMVVKAAKLANEYDVSIKTVNKLIEKGDPAAVKLENARAESIIAQMDKLTEASDVGGREVARSLSIRRMMVNRETYDLAHIVQRAQAAKGRKLTTAERGKFEQITAEHGRLQEKLKTVEANYDKLIAERELMGAEKVAAIERKKAKIEKRKVVLREKIQIERADIKKQLTAMGYRVNDITGITAEGSYLVGKLAVNYIKDGAVSLDAVVKKVLTDLPQLTKRDVYQSLITKDPKVQAKARVETMKRVGQLKTQARLLLDIEKVEKGIFEPITATQRATQPVAIRQLQKKLRDLRATAYKSNMSAARLEKAVKTINELQDQLANQYRSVKKGKPELTPDLSVAREKIKDLRKTMHVADELTKTQEQLRTGNFDIKVKSVEKPILPELERAQIQLKVNRKQIRQAIKEMEPMTAGKVGIEAINTARTLKATADMSAVLRQGLVLSVRRPIKAGKAFGKSFKAFFDKYTAEQIDNAIKSSPNHYLREKAGLQLMEVGGRVARGEEMFMSSVAEKIPLYGRVVKASERHMVSYLNMIRTAAFDQFLQKYPNATHAELKVWANFVNVASGRGNLGKFAGAANTLSLGFFAPRFAVSRIQTPLALFKRGISRRVRKEIAKDLVATASLGATVLTLAHLAGAEVGTDPRSADWGKIKVGNTRIDIWGGMQQPMRVVARTGLGITDKWGLTGEDLTNWQKDVDPVELAARFSQYKLSPLATIPLELYKGETIVGEDVTPTETAIKAMIPMVYEDMADAWRLEGVGQAAWVGGLAFFGAGASTYSRKEGRENTIRKLLEEARRATTTDARKRKESAAKALQTKWNNEHEKDKISIFR